MANKILWHGDFLDGKLTFILPDPPLECPDTAALGYDNTAIIFTICSADFEYISHVHIQNPPQELIEKHLKELLQALREEYLEAVMNTRDSKLNHGTYLQ